MFIVRSPARSGGWDFGVRSSLNLSIGRDRKRLESVCPAPRVRRSTGAPPGHRPPPIVRAPCDPSVIPKPAGIVPSRKARGGPGNLGKLSDQTSQPRSNFHPRPPARTFFRPCRQRPIPHPAGSPISDLKETEPSHRQVQRSRTEGKRSTPNVIFANGCAHQEEGRREDAQSGIRQISIRLFDGPLVKRRSSRSPSPGARGSLSRGKLIRTEMPTPQRPSSRPRKPQNLPRPESSAQEPRLTHGRKTPLDLAFMLRSLVYR